MKRERPGPVVYAHPLAWAIVLAHREAIFAPRGERTAANARWRAAVGKWIAEGMPLHDGESDGSSPPSLKPPGARVRP